MIDLDHTVTAQIRITDMGQAQACAQWLIKHIGPQQPGTVGCIVHGTGWQIRVMDMIPGGRVVAVELDQHVDPQDVIMFLLRWS